MKSENRHKGGIPHAEEKTLPVPEWNWIQSSDEKPCWDEKSTDPWGTLYRLRGRADSESPFCTLEKNLIHTEPLTWLIQVSGSVCSVHSHLLHCRDGLWAGDAYVVPCFYDYRSCKSAKGMSFFGLSLARSVSMIPWALEIGFSCHIFWLGPVVPIMMEFALSLPGIVISVSWSEQFWLENAKRREIG